MGKALLIKSTAADKVNTQGKWHEFEQATPYIQGIVTGDIADNLDSETLNGMISGLPSVWSRAASFGYAFKYTRTDANIQTSGLIKFYEALVAEWQGLIALLALHPARVTLSEPVLLQNLKSNKLFNISNAFGRMLFEDTDLWCNPDDLKATKTEKPFVQLIYYNGSLVGATSPLSFVFPAIDYNNAAVFADVPWFRNGKLDNPLEYGNLDAVKLQKLYLMVKNMADQLPEFENHINTNRNGKEAAKLSALYMFLGNWQNRIKAKSASISEEGTLDTNLKFAAPFTNVFNVNRPVYCNNGIFTFSKEGELVDMQQLLLGDEFIFGFIPDSSNDEFEKAPVYYVSAADSENAGKKIFFPVPLSAYGIRIFKNRIKDLILNRAEKSHELRCVFRPDKYTVLVELFLYVDGKKQTPISKEFEIKHLTGLQRSIIMWPNFISKNWNKYYLYSEYPSNSRDVKFLPYFRKFSEQGGFDAGEYIEKQDNSPLFFTDKINEFEVLKLINYPVEIALAEDHAYEIWRSEKPVGGLEIRAMINGKDRICGYLPLKSPNDDTMGDAKIRDYSHETNFEEVVVGMDFGSNNSCVSYARADRAEVFPVQFTNRRVFLLGNEISDPQKEKIALRNELLFFQNEPAENGQVKSRLHEHNRRYVSGTEQEEISGGVPVFKPNLKIHDMDERTVSTNAGTMHHNMKWLTDQQGREKKKAYLKTLWMHTVADLYANRKRPTELRWSFPGSFSNYDVLQYRQMYREFANIPIAGVRVNTETEPKTEAEAVCNYALTNASLSSSNLLLGIDVGGSTADILLVAMDRNERSFKLVKQSSVRMAASMLTDMVKHSEGLRRALVKYVSSPACKFTIAGIGELENNPKTAPFYFNAILDRLGNNDYTAFYGALAQSYPKIFAVPAYITGLLLYYSGMLTAKTLAQHGYTGIKMVDLLPFGKGGRIFDWLDTYPGKQAASEYYTQCFRAGFGQGSENISIEKKDSIRKDNKSEVAIGLSAPQRVAYSTELRDNSDIFAETGYKFYPKGADAISINPDDVLKAEHFEEMDFGIEIPERFEHFENFLRIFLQFTGPGNSGIVGNTAKLEQAAAQLHRELKAYIINDTEWQKANEQKRSGQAFGYKQSLLITEGLCFWDKFFVLE